MFLKNYKKTLQSEILSRIDFDGYLPAEEQPKTDDDKIIKLIEIARAEVGHEFARHGMTAGLKYWLSGLPSCIDLPVYNGEVIEFAVKIGSVSNPTEKEQDKIIDNFYPFMASNILQMYNAAMRRRERSQAK